MPAYTVPQLPEAMQALEVNSVARCWHQIRRSAKVLHCFISLTCTSAQEAALRQGISLTVTRPLSDFRDAAQQPLALQLAGAHQEQNAALAVALAASWEGSERGGVSARTAQQKSAPLPNGTSALSNGHSADRAAMHEQAKEDNERGSATEHAAAVQAGCLPAPYIHGLRNVSWPGRNQVTRRILHMPPSWHCRASDAATIYNRCQHCSWFDDPNTIALRSRRLYTRPFKRKETALQPWCHTSWTAHTPQRASSRVHAGLRGLPAAMRRLHPVLTGLQPHQRSRTRSVCSCSTARRYRTQHARCI